MYLYYDKNRVLKEIINTAAILQGDVDNDEIYVYWEGFTDNEEITVTSQFYLPNTQLIAPDYDAVKVVKEIPYDEKQDLKFFKYFKEYKFYKINVPIEVLSISGSVLLSVFVYESDTRTALYPVPFYVKETSLGSIAPEEYINIAQYYYLRQLLNGKLSAYTKSLIVDELPEVGQENTIYFLNGSLTGEPYKVYFSNGKEYQYLGEVSGDFASKQEVEGLRGEVTNAFVVVPLITDLPTTNMNKIYIVAEDNNWYYWNGSQYVSGGSFLSATNVLVNVSEPETDVLENIKVGEIVYYFDANFIKYNNGDVGGRLDELSAITYSSVLDEIIVESSMAIYGVLDCESDINMNNGTIEALEMSNNPNCAVNKAYVDKIKDNLDTVKAGLFETIWTNSTASFERLNVATVNRTDDDKTIVSNQYAGLKEIGAFSYAENQLVSSIRNVSTNGCTITPLTNTTFHIEGTAEGSQNTWVIDMGADYTKYANHKILILNNSNIVIRNNDFGRNINEIGTITARYFVIDMVAGTTYNNDVEVKLVDLTLMGLDSITTIVEWEALGIDIPSEYVEPHIVSSRPTTLKSYSEYASVDLGTLTIFVTNANNGIFGTNSLKNLMVLPANNNIVANVKCDKYETTTAGNIYNSAYNEVIAVENSGALYFKSSAFVGKTANEVKTLLSGVILKYQPANPTDAELLGTINLILPTQFISAKEAKDIVKAVAKSNGLYDLVHVSYVGSDDLGSLDWGYNSTAGQERFFSSSLLNIINTSSNINILCGKYEVVLAGQVLSHAKDKIISNISGYISVYDSTCNDTNAFKTANVGVLINYEKAKPTETVIASNLTEEQLKFILQKGGSVALNVAGCDVKLDVVAIDYRE